MKVVLSSVMVQTPSEIEKEVILNLPDCMMSGTGQPLIVGIDNQNNGWARIWYLSGVSLYEGGTLGNREGVMMRARVMQSNGLSHEEISEVLGLDIRLLNDLLH